MRTYVNKQKDYVIYVQIDKDKQKLCIPKAI